MNKYRPPEILLVIFLIFLFFLSSLGIFLFSQENSFKEKSIFGGILFLSISFKIGIILKEKILSFKELIYLFSLAFVLVILCSLSTLI